MEPRNTQKAGKKSPRSLKTSNVSQRDAQSSQDQTIHARIAVRAYEIYDRRTRQGSLDDWFQAEREILNEKRPKRKGQ
ncbi:MAG: DUF2934 domain-containing protein [Nitrospiraceae bacterium]